jgi:hypothetical protein
MSTLQFLDVLEADAVVERQRGEQARRMFASIEHRPPLGSGQPGVGPLYLDGVAIAYLAGAGLLDDLSRSSRDLRVHPQTVVELEQLVRTEADAARSLEILTRVRAWLRDGIAAGHVQVLPRVRIGDEEIGVGMRVLQELLGDIGASDAVLMDDRMAGAQWRATDRSGRTVPIIDTLDLLHEFVRQGLQTGQDRLHHHHVLRVRGLVCLPIEIEELEGYLARQQPDQETGFLRESAELRAIRENLERLRSTTIVQQPAETPYLDRLRLTGLLAIRNIWADVSVPVPTALARTEWLWQNLMCPPVDWAHTIVNPAGVVAPITGFLNEVSTLLMLPVTDLDRGRAFRDWVEATILSPLQLMSTSALDDLTALIHAGIRGWINDQPAIN